MPTGYTAKVNDGSITDLKSYALICARAFGALIEMRDDKLDVPTPRKLPPRESYHKGELQAAKDEFDRLVSLTDEQRAAGAQAANTQHEIDRNDAIAKNLAIGQRYDAMISQVVTWEVPDALTGLRKFMLEQLEQSREFDVSDNPGGYIPPPMTAEAWYLAALSRTAKDIVYHAEHFAEDSAREAERNAWLDALWSSLEGTDA